ncbi:ATP-binding protein [Streptomyces sp. IMTB 1903]|uniref:ATP-binding protein n=1 Tax=Streptomyces sp. IMTB 1903 TaxID=1776680 RepID=UPI0007C79824|nr:ATP-binding protein [Streptomyces sp. IMTB 1903]
MSGLRAARHAPSRHAVTGPARQIRPQLVRAALLPTLAAALSGAAAVIFTLQLGGGAGDRDARLWPVLTGCALLTVGALAAALLGAQRAAKAVRDRCEALRRSSVRGRQELRTAADRLERGEAPPRPVRGGPNAAPTGGDPAGVDEFWLLSQELRGAREQAHTTLLRLAGPAAPTDSERKVEVFVNLARRLQSLVHREIALLDELEDTVEDPDLLRELFHVDHLATRIRRHAENLAVLGGAASRRQWTRPIDLSEVLRSSVAEVEQYTRVKVVPPAGGSVRGHAVADVVHLLAELVENATVFSAPDTDVVLRAERVTAGIAVEVEDRGLGMPPEEQHRMNALLGDPDQVSVRSLLADGRIGLYVVSTLARRHGIAVELKSNIYGGVLAVLVLPLELLGAAEAGDAAGGSRVTPPLEPVRMPLPRRADPAAPASRPEPAPTAWPPPGESWGATTTGTGGAPPPRPGTPTSPPYGREPARAEDAWASEADPSGPVARPGSVAGRRAEPGAAAPVGREAAREPGSAQGGPGTGPVAAPEPAGAPPYGREPARAEGTSEPLSGFWGTTSAAADGGPLDARQEAEPASRPSADPWVVAGGEPSGRPGSEVGRSGEPEPWSEPEAGPQAASVAGSAEDSRPSAEPGWWAAWDATASPSELRGAVPAESAPTGPWAVADGGPGAAAGPRAVPVRPTADGRSAPSGDPGSAADAWSGSGGGPSDGARPGEPAGHDAGERPMLPRRRAQQHLAPQLRDAPAPRRPTDGEQPVHDPGLMAAFQRGFGRAQSENQA